MSVSIRALPKKAIGACGLCTTEGELPFWDSDLAGRICQECAPFLRAAEVLLVGAKCGHPADFLIFRNSEKGQVATKAVLTRVVVPPRALDLLRELLGTGEGRTTPQNQ
jgi:hypothetical protein